MRSIDKINFHLKRLGKDSAWLSNSIQVSTSAISQWNTGKTAPTNRNLKKCADLFEVDVVELMDDTEALPETLKAPGITEDFVAFPVLGEVAAGFDRMGFEDWTGDTIEIPASYLKGRKAEDFFVLRVFGESMYPMYQHGDCVLVLRQDHLTRSGEIGVVLYDDEKATLKRVEYTEGKVKLVPVNPNVPPVTIEGEALEHYRVLGVPKWVIREIEE